MAHGLVGTVGPYVAIAVLSFAASILAFGFVGLIGVVVLVVGIGMGLGSNRPIRIATAERCTLVGVAILVGPTVYMALALV